MRQPHPRPLISNLSPFPGLIRTPTSPLCHTLRHPADRSVRLLQPSLAGEVRTSVRSMARVRAARCGLGGGASSLQSDVVVACGLRGRTLRVRSADRFRVSWRLLSEPEQEHHPGAARWTTGRQLGGGLWRRRRHRRPLARVSTRCCVRRWGGRGGARDGGSWPPRTRRVAV